MISARILHGLRAMFADILVIQVKTSGFHLMRALPATRVINAFLRQCGEFGSKNAAADRSLSRKLTGFGSLEQSAI